MKFLIVKALTFAIVFNPLLAGIVWAASADDDMKDEQQSFQEFVKQFPDKPSSNNFSNQSNFSNNNTSGNNIYASARVSGNTIPKPKNGINDLYSTAYYNQASQSDWVKAKVMTALSSLAQSLGNIASSVAGSSSGQTEQTATPGEVQAAVSQTSQIGSALSASNDPQFQQMGQSFQTESTQIANGNTPAALESAQAIASIPVPQVSPDYVPSQGESLMVQGLVTGVEIAASVYFGPIGGAICSALFSILGLSGFGTTGLVAGSGAVSQVASGAVSGQSGSAIISAAAPNAVAATGLSSSAPAINNYLNSVAPSVAAPKTAPMTQSGTAPAGN